MKKIKLLFMAVLMLASYSLIAQVAITTDGSSADNSAMLDVKSANKGFLAPRVALTSDVNSPATGLLVYQTGGTPGFYFYNGTAWTAISQTADGSETKVTAGTNVSVTGSGTTASPYVVNATSGSTLAIGDSYQGGIIFWLDATGQHGLIAATADQSTAIQWSNGTARYTGTTGDGLYAGAMNTALIVATQMADNQTGNFAAKVCADYSVAVGGVTYGDWYLPSIYELNLLYSQKTAVGGFANAYYWSSTELDDDYAKRQLFGNNFYNADLKYATCYVRAVRAF